MSGHNKWSKIKHQKAIVDSRKSTAFSKLTRKITIAARDGGGDPAMNAALALLVEKAKETNMPKDTVLKAIKKGTGELGETTSYETLTYEGYGPFGVAILIMTATDNKNRTVSEIRTILERGGGSLGTTGSASYIFDKQLNPTFEISLTEDDYKKVRELLSELEEQADVLDVYANYSKA